MKLFKLTQYGAAILAILLLASCKESRKADVTKPSEIRLAYVNGELQLPIIQKLGWFDEEFGKDSIRVTLQRFEYGPPEIESFIAGNIDLGTLGDQPAIVGWANGLDIKAIGTITGGFKYYGLAAAANSGINSIADLKGKKVAVAIGTVYHHLLFLYLEKAGLKSSDIQIVNLKFSDSVTALASGNIDAVVVGEPFLSLIQAKQIGKVITYSEGLKYAAIPVVVTNDFASKYPDYTIRLLKLIDRANQWALAHPSETADALIAESPLLPKPVAVNLIGLNVKSIRLDANTDKAFNDTYIFVRSQNIIRNDKDIKTFYDYSFLDKAGIK